ncbi:MAG: hypothetical protein AAFO61_09385 [Pseudomonadota bacterium]
MSTEPHHITDHAIVCMLERFYGLDVDGLRAFMAAQVAGNRYIRAPKLRINGVEYVFDGDAVVTVQLPQQWRAKAYLGRKRASKHAKRQREAWIRGE